MKLLTAGEYALAITAILTLMGLLLRFLVLIPLKSYIEKLTYPIQPHANGGKSLPDVVLGIEAIKLRIDSVERRVMRLEDSPNNYYP
jgi:hypothetical protein